MDDLNLESGDDLLCIACGYDLRELPREGDCPECGLPINRSIGSDQLDRTHPDWLVVIVRGLRLMAWSIRCGALLFLVFILVMFISLTMRASLWYTVAIGLFGGAVSISLLIFGIGAFLFGTLDPGRTPERDQPKIRLILRYGFFVSVLLVALAFVLDFFPIPAAMLAVLVTMIICIAYGIGFMVLAMSMKRLAALLRRIPEGKNAEKADKFGASLVWFAPFVITVNLFTLYLQINVPSGLPVWMSPAIFSALLSMVGSVFGFVLIVRVFRSADLMWSTRESLQTCLDISRKFSERSGAP